VNGEEKKLKRGAGKFWVDDTYKKIDIKLIGAWDTVGSLGWPRNQMIDDSRMNRNKRA